MELNRALLLLTLPVVVTMVLIVQNWNEGFDLLELAAAYGAGIAVGVVWQKFRDQ